MLARASVLMTGLILAFSLGMAGCAHHKMRGGCDASCGHCEKSESSSSSDKKSCGDCCKGGACEVKGEKPSA